MDYGHDHGHDHGDHQQMSLTPKKVSKVKGLTLMPATAWKELMVVPLPLLLIRRNSSSS